MPHCPSCGKEVDANAAFCPNCGASLKPAPAPSGPKPAPIYRNEKAERNEKREKDEKSERAEKLEKREKREFSMLGSVVAGLILIAFGVTMSLTMMGYMRSPTSWAWFIVLLGVAIIVLGIYAGTTARTRYPKV